MRPRAGTLALVAPVSNRSRRRKGGGACGSFCRLTSAATGAGFQPGRASKQLLPPDVRSICGLAIGSFAPARSALRALPDPVRGQAASLRYQWPPQKGGGISAQGKPSAALGRRGAPLYLQTPSEAPVPPGPHRGPPQTRHAQAKAASQPPHSKGWRKSVAACLNAERLACASMGHGPWSVGPGAGATVRWAQ
jgi:hypothetical protein